MTKPMTHATPQSDLVEGDPAPAFALATADGPISNESFSGKTVVLFFYPKDNTPGCTTEAIEFTALNAEFEKAGAMVIGVSKDSLRKHENFTEKHNLNVLLASDAEGSVCEDFGAWREKKMYGKTFWGIERSTFVLDHSGQVARIWRKVKAKGHAAEVLDAIQSLTS